MNNNKILVFTVLLLCCGLAACDGKKDNEYQVKSAFIGSCIQQESSTRSLEQAKSYCDCAADAVFSNRNISEETKKLMPTMNDKNSRLYQQSDAAMVKGAMMSCYTAKFYKK
ncbi:MAG: hypothetical protein ACXWF8_09095 [Methylobacter sp.]